MGDSGAERPRYWTRAALMRRAFDFDILRCPRCSERMQLMATIDAPAVIQRILAHLGFPGVRDGPPPPAAVSAAGAEQRALPCVTR
jgi:hypothetical protein